MKKKNSVLSIIIVTTETKIWYHKNMDPICIHSVPIISNTFDVKQFLVSTVWFLFFQK